MHSVIIAMELSLSEEIASTSLAHLTFKKRLWEQLNHALSVCASFLCHLTCVSCFFVCFLCHPTLQYSSLVGLDIS